MEIYSTIKYTEQQTNGLSCESEIEIQRKQKQQGFYHIRTVVIHYVILLR